jgi:ATP-dependent helicase/nuclease subunit B
MLGYLINNLKNSSLVSGADIYITGFEHISIQRGAVILEIMKRCKEFTAGFRAGSEFETFIKSACIEIGGIADIKCFTDLAVGLGTGAEVKFLSNVQSEAVWVANRICGLVKCRGVRYRDIAVVLSDYDNTVKIFESAFLSNGIAVNVDVGEDLLSNPLAQFLVALLGGGKPENVVSLINNPYCTIARDIVFELENMVLKNNLFAGSIENEIFVNEIFPYIEQLGKSHTVSAICGVLLECLEGLPEIAESKQEVARKKLTELLTSIDRMLGVQKITLQDFGNMFGTLTSATKISAIPTYADCVMLVSAKDYEVSPVKYLFVAGANAGAFPIEQDDTEILTEFDISNVSEKIEPTARMQNARARAHAINVLESCTGELFVSYTAMSARGEETRPSDLAEKIIKGQGERARLASAELVEPNGIYSAGYARKVLLEAISSGEAFADRGYYNAVLRALDIGDIKIPVFDKKPESLYGASELFFANNVARVTQFENFYKCPYYHFLTNGLKLKARERYQVASNMLGSLIHKFVELYLNALIAVIGDTKKAGLKANLVDVESADFGVEIEPIIREVLGMKEYSRFASDPLNKPIIKVLRKDLFRIADLISDGIRTGVYSPVFTEKSLEGAFKGVTVRGVADRVDSDSAGNAVIIDYKTGGGATFSYKDLYLGVKLQLPLYMSFLPAGLNAVGAYYMSLKGGFVKRGDVRKLLSGLLPDSVTDEQLNAVIGYAKRLTEDAVEKIKAGYIAPSPHSKRVCEYCIMGASCAFRGCDRGILGGDRVGIKTIEGIMRGRV